MRSSAEGPMPAVFVGPRRYIQGRGVIHMLGEELVRLGAKKPLILRDEIVAELAGDVIETVEGAYPIDFGGECSAQEIERVMEIARTGPVDALVGIGGGKVLDVARSVAFSENLPMIIAPTIAATDSPTSSLAVIYSEEGVFEEVRYYGRNPDSVIVDTEIITKAPVRLFVAGMGDALATYFEAETAAHSGTKTIAGGTPTEAALAIAQLCYDLVVKHGRVARIAVEQQCVTAAVEKVIEANTLLSGLGFESGGVSTAHSLHNGLTILPETHDYLHGEKVAFGVICQLILEGCPDERIEEVLDFCLKVGLPVTLGDIGLGNISPEGLNKVAKRACVPHENIHNEPFNVYPSMVVDALGAADVFGQHRRSVLKGQTILPVVAQ